ncbi:MAG: CPBP family intramembrane glutamic endopeptidase [Chloroflexota bacterium]
MVDGIAAIPVSPQQASSRQLLRAAWLIVLILTVPEIILRAFMGMDTSWMLPARIVLLAGLFAFSFAQDWFRPLRGFVLILLIIYGVEGLVFGTFVLQTPIYQQIFGSSAEMAFFGERLLRIGAVIGMLLVLLGMGLKRRDFYLTWGNPSATAEPDPVLHLPPKPEPWTRFGRNYALISTVLLLVFLVPALQPSLSNFSLGLVLFAAVCAALNAFAEEFLYRAALLPQLLPLFPKHRTLLLVALWFGLAHYFGVPSGITGVLLTALGGWFFAKAMTETRGIGVPWLMHFLSDFAVYLVILLAGAL